MGGGGGWGEVWHIMGNKEVGRSGILTCSWCCPWGAFSEYCVFITVSMSKLRIPSDHTGGGGEDDTHLVYRRESSCLLCSAHPPKINWSYYPLALTIYSSPPGHRATNHRRHRRERQHCSGAVIVVTRGCTLAYAGGKTWYMQLVWKLQEVRGCS